MRDTYQGVPGRGRDGPGSVPTGTAAVTRREPGGSVDLVAYRGAVAEVVASVDRTGRRIDQRQIVTWLQEPALRQLLMLLPGGLEAAEAELHEELGHYHHHRQAQLAHRPAAYLQIFLLSRIDVLWWGGGHAFVDDRAIATSGELTEVQRLRRQDLVRFTYHRLPRGVPGRGRDWVRRHLVPWRRPRTAGLRITRVRPEMLLVMNRLALELQREAPPGTPPMWVTSMVRSSHEQEELRHLGYPAFVRSAHSYGYAFDVEVEWFRRFGADRVLKGLLLDHQRAGAINAIDEGQVWHVCLSPQQADMARHQLPGGGR